jgi:hypothetical protein
MNLQFVMKTNNPPGFTAEKSLLGLGSQRSLFNISEASGVITAASVSHVRGDAPARLSKPANIVPADVPGGPGTVPIGYERACKRVPYTVCDAYGCRTEYGWVCTYRPLPRAY